MSKDDKGADAGQKRDKRGTQDEIEVLAQIVQNTPSVRTLVMNRLKEAKDRALKAREQQLRNVQ